MDVSHPIRILLVDDHPVLRRGLAEILAEGLGPIEFGEAQDAAEALDQIGLTRWDVVVLDISMPGRNGIEVLKEVHRHRANLPVLVLSMLPPEQYAVRVMRAGARGYMAKESAPDEIVGAIRRILDGGRYLPQAVAEAMAASLVESDAEKPHEALSDRELQVMMMLASGQTVGAAAAALSLSVKTISTYRTRILGKMGMKTNADLMRYAVDHGLES